MTTAVIDSAFTVPARLQSLAFVRSALECILDRDPWAAEEMGRLLLASGEALCNAIEHGSVPEGTISVRVTVDPRGVTFSVADAGRPGARPRVDLQAGPPPEGSVHGRGILIMRELSDEITVTPSGGGVRLTMVFVRDAVLAAEEARARRAA